LGVHLEEAICYGGEADFFEPAVGEVIRWEKSVAMDDWVLF
jgi:hypothetical protein